MNKSLTLILIIIINILFSTAAYAEYDFDTIIMTLNNSKVTLEESSKAGSKVASKISVIVDLINNAQNTETCTDSLSTASNNISNTIRAINSTTCKSKKSSNKCIPKNTSREVKTTLISTQNELNGLLETDEDSNGQIDACETDVEFPSPTPSETPTETPSSTPSPSPQIDIGTCSPNQKIPPIEELQLNTKGNFTDNLGSVEIYRHLDDNGAVFKIKNTTYSPIEIMISLNSGSLNITPTIPETISINAMSTITGFKICATSPNSSWNYNGFNFTTKLGSSSSSHNGDGKYILPFKSGESYEVIQGETGTFSHFDNNLYSIDFGMPESSSIVAMRDGTVLTIKEDSNEGGSNKDLYINKGNFIWIIHDDNSFGYYYHLKQNGALVSQGTKVKAGDIIGLSGNTGFSSTPHLHVQVDLPKGFSEAEKIPIRFKGINGALIEGDTYKAN